MQIQDYLYGNFIVEPIIEELINTKEVQRLKKIHQGGANYLVNKSLDISRYEHSIGVMLLIKILNGSLEEQIAGLLHDVSHTAFSHVIDYALDKENEDYHEEIFEKIIEKSDIPQILKKYGYDYKEIVYNESKYTILEKPAPNLCADRVDYTLRDMYRYKFIKKEDVDEIIKSLIIVNGEIMMNSIKGAELFVETYYKEVIEFFLDPLNIYANDRLAKSIRIALKQNIIQLDDLLEDDEYVYNLLCSSNNDDLNKLIKSINTNVKVIYDDKNYDIYQINKLRLVNPKIYINNNIYLSEEVSSKVKNINKRAFEKSKIGVYVRIL